MPLEVTSSMILAAFAITFAIYRGSMPERCVSISLITWILVDWIFHYMTAPANYGHVIVAHVIFDTFLMFALFATALRANRVWPCWAAASSLIVVFGHLVAAVYGSGMQRAYWAMTQLPFFIQLLTLIVGTALHMRRRRILGPYTDWRVS